MSTKFTSLTEKLEKEFGPLTFADFIKSWRLCDEISQTAFAKKLSISPQNLNDLEKGRRIPSASRAAKIARKIGFPEQTLIQLALRDYLRKEGFNYDIVIKSA